MLTVMTTPARPPVSRSSCRAAPASAGAARSPRPVPWPKPLYEFGGGFPDPASFPYDGMVEATAKMMKAEGADALTYGDAQGYRGLRELICPQVQALREPLGDAREHLRRQRLGCRARARLQCLRGPGRADDHRGPDLFGLPQQHPSPRPGDLRRAGRRRRHGHQRRAREPRDDQAPGPPVQAHLYDRQLPEPGRPRPVDQPAPGADRARARSTTRSSWRTTPTTSSASRATRSRRSTRSIAPAASSAPARSPRSWAPASASAGSARRPRCCRRSRRSTSAAA